MAGCATTGPSLSTPSFRADEVAWAKGPGKNTIRGSAILRTNGGETRTCAGAAVAVIPDSAFTRDRMQNLYGGSERGVNDLAYGAARKVDPAPPEYARTVRQTTCDIKGNFLIEGVPDGTWYVTTAVTWFARGNDPLTQVGTAFMRRIAVSGATTVTIVFAP
ncbi:MAG: hypothetical protein H7125_03795 [Proteobacteria bacterium]|nr:hypothetical protein [Burkholderiales bacterium]